MKKKKKIMWVIAIFITLIAVFYQKITGPTYPKKVNIEVNNKTYNFKLIRSFGGNNDAKIDLEIADTSITAKIFYRHFPSDEKYISADFSKQDIIKRKIFGKDENIKGLSAFLPNQPPAGKLQYYIVLNDNGRILNIQKDNPIVIRFKGDVPLFILIPHIIFMFIAMFLSTLTALYALAKIEKFKVYANITFFALLIGGMILGPLVQKYAFGELWTGIPFGWDLTDNKTLIAFVFWAVAILINWKKTSRIAVVIAAIVLMLIFSIPHSMYGSELNRDSGKIEQA